jgi:hypothetical protein
MGNMHPLFSSILDSAAQAPIQIERAAYVSRLIRMDWSFEFADDGAVYRQGKAELAALMAIREAIDADHALWNKHAPHQYMVLKDVHSFKDFTGNAPVTVEWIAGESGPVVIAVVVETPSGPRSIQQDIKPEALARYQAAAMKAAQVAA